MRRSPVFLFAAAVGLLASGLPALAEEPLVTDRPGATDSASVVPRGRVQLETGGVFAGDDADGVDFDVTQLLATSLRIGLAERWELRIGWDGRIDEELDIGAFKADVDGTGDTNIALRLGLREEGGKAPAMALIAGTTLPSGSDEITSDNPDPFFRVAFAQGLTDRLSLGYNVGASWSTQTDLAGDEDTLGSALYTASLGIAISDRVGAFVELFGNIPLNAGGGPANSVDAGLAFPLRPNLQLDVSAGVGISDDAVDEFVSAGLSVRFPPN